MISRSLDDDELCLTRLIVPRLFSLTSNAPVMSELFSITIVDVKAVLRSGVQR
jgi:hypothetical protein